jgi:hypothetical protein
LPSPFQEVKKTGRFVIVEVSEAIWRVMGFVRVRKRSGRGYPNTERKADKNKPEDLKAKGRIAHMDPNLDKPEPRRTKNITKTQKYAMFSRRTPQHTKAWPFFLFVLSFFRVLRLTPWEEA